MILGRIKSYAIAGGAAVIGLLLVVVKYLSAKNSRLARRAETVEANLNRARVIAEKDNEIEGQTRSHRAEVANELETDGTTDALSNPGSLWDSSDD
jgi:hypothetical protein